MFDMLCQYFVFIFLLITCSSANDVDQLLPPTIPAGYKWIHSVFCFRHTARGPNFLADTNTIVMAKDFSRGVANALEKGLIWAQRTGKSLQTRYEPLMNGDWDATKAWARSSTVDRCYETTVALQRGLFGIEYKGLPNIVQTIRATNGQDKYISCPRPNPTDYSSVFGVQIPGTNKTIRDIFALVRKQGKASSDAVDSTILGGYVDGFKSARWNGNKLPKWVLDNYYAMEYAYEYIMSAGGPYIAQEAYVGYFFMNGIAERIETVLAQDPSSLYKSKISLFGYHDTSVEAAVGALNKDYLFWYCNFLGGITFDIIVNEQNSTDVRVMTGLSGGLDDTVTGTKTMPPKYYLDSVKYQPIEPFKIEDCDEDPCSLEQFLYIMRNAYNEADTLPCGCVNSDAKNLIK